METAFFSRTEETSGWVIYAVAADHNKEFELCLPDDLTYPSISTEKTEKDFALLWGNTLNKLINNIAETFHVVEFKKLNCLQTLDISTPLESQILLIDDLNEKTVEVRFL